MKSQAFFLVLVAGLSLGLSGCVSPVEEPNACEGREEGWTCIEGALHGVCEAGVCIEPVAPLPHVDGQCFALADRVYPASYAWCAQVFGWARPVPFACMVEPPAEACEPVAGYADRFCCCDPTTDATCVFYK